MNRFSWLCILLFIPLLDLHAQTEYLLEHETIPGTDTVWVFTPESYNPELKYPVVYMLHGYSSNYSQWHQIMDAQSYANEYNMIIVSPDGFFDSWYLNSPKKEDSQFIDFFFDQLVPFLDEKYSIDDRNRFITGLSMGGHGALLLFLNSPQFFNTAGSTSGIMDLRSIDKLFGINDHLGALEEGEELWLSLSAIGNISKLKETGREIIFDCGTEDPFYEWNKVFYEKCLEEKVPTTFISQAGKHDWDYWAKSIRAHFLFFESNLRK